MTEGFGAGRVGRNRGFVVVLGAALAFAVACGGRKPGPVPHLDVGTMSAHLQLAAELDVDAVLFEAKSDAGKTFMATIKVRQGGLGGMTPGASNQRFADWLVALPAGHYLVKATPLTVAGQPSAQCPAAMGEVQVIAQMTAELVLVSNCSGPASGGLDVTIVLNTPPIITTLDSPSGKLLCLDEAFVAKVAASDPEGDKLTYAWSVTSTPEGVKADSYCLAAADEAVAFSAMKPGKYELTVEVSDGRTKARLTFPVYIDGGCGVISCPGKLAAKALPVAPTSSSGLCMCKTEIPTVTTSQNVQPVKPFVAALDGNKPRPVARYMNARGRAVDFVADELLVMPESEADITALLARWPGEVRGKIEFTALGVAAKTIYRVAINPAAADTATLPALWAESAKVTGAQTFSSDGAVKLMTAALTEMKDSGLKVGLNFLMESADFASRSTQEEPLGGDVSRYSSRNAYDWPYMNRASEQDIGTGEAWTVMNAAGRLGNRVRLGIADGGFRPNADFPAMTTVFGPVRTPNPSSCTGGGSCPWHGTHVSLSAAAIPDNNTGVAGSAGPVADLILLQSPAEDFFAYMEYIFRNIVGALASRPQIINVSASSKIPAEACLAILGGLPVCEVLNATTAGFRAANILVFAAAGNTNEDVDRTTVFGVCPFCAREEAEIVVPCELSGVTCVGGLSWDSNDKDPASSFGSAPSDGGSVDIYGPFEVFSVADPVAADIMSMPPNLAVGVVGGTSFSSPYVAGVAALVWASNPTLSANQVDSILLGTAHTTSRDARVPRWVNALGAVTRALGRNAPPFLRITTPDRVVPLGSSVVLTAVVEEIDGDAFEVVWRRGTAVVGRGLRIIVDTTGLPLGSNPITAQATDSRGNTSAIDTVRISLTPVMTPPETRLVSVPDSGTLCPRGPERGDAEFNGGPAIDVQIALRISDDQLSLLADVAFAAEGRGDDSLVTESFTLNLHTVAAGESIVRINSPDTFSLHFNGPGGGFELEPFGCNDGAVVPNTFASGLVRQIDIIGDTGSSDISSDGDCHCDTQIRNIAFNPVSIGVTH